MSSTKNPKPLRKSQKTAPLSTIVQTLDSLLNPRAYKDIDIGWNGLQVEGPQTSVSKVGLAVDSGLSVIQEAVKHGCNLLIAHHGLFWGEQDPCVTGVLAQKIQILIQGGCSLYASHLPLDGHQKIGNAAQISQLLGLVEVVPAFGKVGAPCGVVGHLGAPLKREELSDLILPRIRDAGNTPEGLLMLPIKLDDCSGKDLPPPQDLTCSLLFGAELIRSVGIVTGSGSSLLSEAKELGCDLFLSGEPKHEAYHLTKELKMNALFAGHYNTEVFGVQALGRYLENELQLSTCFIHEPSGI